MSFLLHSFIFLNKFRNEYENIANSFKEVDKDITYEGLKSYDRNHEIYKSMVRSIKDKKKQRLTVEKLYMTIQRNTGNIKQYFQKSFEHEKVSDILYTSTPLTKFNETFKTSTPLEYKHHSPLVCNRDTLF